MSETGGSVFARLAAFAWPWRRGFDPGGRTVLVAGRRDGLAPSIARELARRGARVAILAADDGAGSWDGALRISADLSDPSAVGQGVRRVEQELGPIDLLVHDAGISPDGSPREALAGSLRRQLLEPLHTSLAVLSGMRARGSGAIVHLAALERAAAPIPELLALAAGRFALGCLCEGLRAASSPRGIAIEVFRPRLAGPGPLALLLGGLADALEPGQPLDLRSLEDDLALRRILEGCGRARRPSRAGSEPLPLAAIDLVFRLFDDLWNPEPREREDSTMSMDRREPHSAAEDEPLLTREDAERWASLVAGGALALYGISRRSIGGALLAIAGGAMAYRGGGDAIGDLVDALREKAGPILERRAAKRLSVTQTVTIQRPVQEVFAFWREFQNLPCAMRHVESITAVGDGRWHWVVRAPAGSIAFDVETTEIRPPERIAWRSSPGSEVDHEGLVEFRPGPAGEGCEVRVRLDYAAPLTGRLGKAVASLFGQDPGRRIRDDLVRLKQYLEAGEIASTEGQPTGERSTFERILGEHRS